LPTIYKVVAGNDVDAFGRRVPFSTISSVGGREISPTVIGIRRLIVLGVLLVAAMCSCFTSI
jgi:hypothetical protein